MIFTNDELSTIGNLYEGNFPMLKFKVVLFSLLPRNFKSYLKLIKLIHRLTAFVEYLLRNIECLKKLSICYFSISLEEGLEE